MQDGYKIVVEVTNDKTILPDTGLKLDSLPYIIILGAVAVAVVVIIIVKRRRQDDED